MLFYIPAIREKTGTHIQSPHAWLGLVRVAVIDRNTGKIKRASSFKNLITSAGKDFFSSQLTTLAQPGISYVAVGNVNTTPVSGDTQLGNEIFRKQVTKQTQTGGSNNLLTTIYLASYETNQQIYEIGWFAGSAVSATANSGIMVAHVLYSHLKTNTESLQIDRTDQF